METNWSRVFTALAFILAFGGAHEDHAHINCFSCFDNNKDDLLSPQEFKVYLEEIFEEAFNAYFTKELKYDAVAILSRFSSTGVALSRNDFKTFYENFVEPLLLPKLSGLIVVDVQNDFISGSLALKNSPAGQDGLDVVAPINKILAKQENSNVLSAVVYSEDWHPKNHVSFFSNLDLRPLAPSSTPKSELSMFSVATFRGTPDFNQTLWPDHCIQKSWGAKLHPDLKIIDGAIFQKKGTNPDIDSYSVFFDNVRSSSTGLDTKLKSANVRTVFVSGLATDYCVGFTTLDALSIDLNAFLITDASRGVTDPTIADMLDRVVEQGGILVNTDAVLHLMDNLSTVETSTSSRIFLAPSLMVTLTFWTLFRL